MEEVINEKRDEKVMKINVLNYFTDSEVYTKYFYKRGKSIRELKNLKSDFKLEDVTEFHITRYGKPIRLALIFEINTDWFYISELLRTDGHISKNLDRIKLTSITPELKDKFRSFFYKYGIDHFRDTDKDNDRILIFNRTLALILNKIFEIPAGNKTFICRMPKWMKNADLELLAFALRGAFDGDGCVQLTKRKGSASTRRIRIYGASIGYLEDIKFCLSRFSINSQIFKDPRENNTYFLQISRRDDIVKFAKEIGFVYPKRKKLLEEVVSSYKDYYFLDDFEKVVTRILKEKGPVTIGQLAKEVKRKDSTVSEQITKLEKEGKIKTKRVGVKRIVFLIEYRSFA